MPLSTPIRVFNIARTHVNREEVERWLETLGVAEWEHPLAPGEKDHLCEEIPFAEPEDFDGKEEVTNPAYLIALAAKNCYRSFEVGLNPNVTRVRKVWSEYLDNILASGHGNVLEHATYTYAINGCTRVMTAELNRHRAGWAISEQSQRYIRFDKEIQYWMPRLFSPNERDDEETSTKKTASRMIFQEAFSQMEVNYRKLCELWNIDGGNFTEKKKLTSAFRRIVGQGCCTGGVWTGNIRALRHVLALRCSPHAEEEIAHVFSLIGADIIQKEPMLFCDFHRDENGFLTPRYAKV